MSGISQTEQVGRFVRKQHFEFVPCQLYKPILELLEVFEVLGLYPRVEIRDLSQCRRIATGRQLFELRDDVRADRNPHRQNGGTMSTSLICRDRFLREPL